MSSRFVCLPIVIACGSLFSAWGAESAKVSLTKAQLKVLQEELLPAQRAGDAAGVIKAATSLSAKLDAAHRAAGDKALEGEGLAPLSDLITDTRLRLVEQGLAKSAPQVQPREAVLLLTTLKERIAKLLADGNAHPCFGKKEPVTLDEYEQLFWKMHVFSNQFTSAERFYVVAQEIKPLAEKYKAKDKKDPALAVQKADWEKIKSDMADLRERFASRDRDLRVARLSFADKVLTDSKDVKERLLAALVVDMDGEILPPLLAKDSTFPADQAEKVGKTIEHARQTAGRDLVQKSRWLFTGLHWWFRGRYGVGTAGNGLLKDQAALKSPDVMFGLLMPINPPVPNAPGSKQPNPLVDRRHHYLWQFETQKVVSSGSQSSSTHVDSQGKPQVSSVTTMSHFY
jgi:hypothetical protein